MKILLCCIAKLENNYIKEWVDYHKTLGFDNIVICDNNDDDSLDKILENDIKNDFVKIENYRKVTNKSTSIQGQAYKDCYKKYSNLFDWIAFIDVDEFINLNSFSNIQSYLQQEKFKNFDIIRLCWKLYDDNDLLKVENDNYSIKRFTREKKHVHQKACKSIIKTKLNFNNFSSHGCYDTNNACDCNGKLCNNKDYTIGEKPIYGDAWINHYWMKTIEEYVKTKVVRGDPTKQENKYKDLKFFFWLNKKTIEKEKYGDELMKLYFSTN